ncbi:hypothetical protein WMY93_007041 [Mugilogobius chulae]|uniref:Uncharacterized protein n=1 Tax=Mugilogobius chulae TaxID=88201 RepID=A0AAW0PQA3_9GOBI
MCKKQALRDLVTERLVCAADEIFALIEKAFAEYEEEIVRLKWAKVQQEQNCAQQKQADVQIPLASPEVILEPKVEDPTLCTSLDFEFPPLPVKSEDDLSKTTFLQLQELPAKENEQGSTGQLQGRQEEPGCSSDLQPKDNEAPYSCSDTDDSADWDNSARKSTQNNQESQHKDDNATRKSKNAEKDNKDKSPKLL